MDFWFCLLICGVLRAGSLLRGAEIPRYVETNGTLTMRPRISGDVEEILWKLNGNKMVEWDRMGSGVTEYLQFKGRTRLNTKTGDINITRATINDGGLYEADIIINAKIHFFKERVTIIDPVLNSRITCKTTDPTVTLHCDADGPLLEYSWSGPGLQKPENRQQIQISSENLGFSYACVVKNPVSEEKQSYTAGNCGNCGNLVSPAYYYCALLMLSLLVL
ncbi:uncharacterized protein LOC114765258 [Denticeps clupeoides]|uniref:uncharacterized protein LOC114765258 n=1 Tax=Denticeps clupeoides TaxID=299321 RepID=UPI0010A3C7CD|nr:uncharacterized protein LOC114765258 [Denticeps clupeoides]